MFRLSTNRNLKCAEYKWSEEVGRRQALVANPSTCGEVRSSFDELVLSFYLVGPWDGTQVVRLGGRRLYLLSPLAGPGDG